MSLTPAPGESKKRVCYFFDSDIGNYHYGPGHPMKPTRIRMCHSLVMNYGLYNKMEIFRAKPATKREMSQFHTDDYVDFLARITPENMNLFAKEQVKYNVGDDCPVFDGLFEYCSISAGGSMEGAARLSRDKCDIAINWAGGLHHAKKAEASGFCYINDIVLGILELLRYHKRVLYIDIDVHHGDGVEEAFYTTDRVMTVSLHKYGEFFPGTGGVRDRGIGGGKGYSVNVPLHDGINDASYASIFQPVIQRVVEWYQPCAIVLQCGSDSLSGDKLGGFNLSMKGHAECVKFVKSFGLPLLLLGGGGYTMRNVARAWCYETGLAAGVELGHKLPINEYFSYFGPDYELDVQSSNMDDLNTPEYLQKLKSSIFDQMRDKSASPSVQIHQTPAMPHDEMDDAEFEDEEDPNDRKIRRLMDQRIAPETELSDSEDESAPTGAPRRDRRSHRSNGHVSIMNGLYDAKGKSRATASPPRSIPSPKIPSTTHDTIDTINSISSINDINDVGDLNPAQPDIPSYASSVIPIPVLEPAGLISTSTKPDEPMSSTETLPQDPTEPLPTPVVESVNPILSPTTATTSIAIDTPAAVSALAPTPAFISDQVPTSKPAPITSSIIEKSAGPPAAESQPEPSPAVPASIGVEDPLSTPSAAAVTASAPVVVPIQPTTVEPMAEPEPKPEIPSESEHRAEPEPVLFSESSVISNGDGSNPVLPERVPTLDETMTDIEESAKTSITGADASVSTGVSVNVDDNLNGMEDGELEEGELRQDGDKDEDVEMA